MFKNLTRPQIIGVLAMLLGPVACGEVPPTQAPAAPTTAARSAAAAPTMANAAQQSDAQMVAKGIALATKNPSVRAHLRNAMRESRKTDHKLLLQDFVRTKRGDAVVQEIATELQMTAGEIQSRIAGLPAMDFYVPFRAHRLSWKGSPELSVAASFEPDAPTLAAFAPNGLVRTLRLSDGDPAQTLIVMHPAEPTRVRVKNDTANPSETIQSPKEGGITTLIECDVDCSGGGGGYVGGTGPTPGLYLTQFYSHRGDGWWGSLEMEFRSAGWEGNVQYLGNGFWYSDSFCPKYTGTANLEPGQNYTNLLLAVGPGITNVAAVRCNFQYNPYGYEMIAYESDGGLNGSGDDFGRRFFYGGTIPFGAAVGYQLPYYSGGGTPSDGQLSVEMTLQYR